MNKSFVRKINQMIQGGWNVVSLTFGHPFCAATLHKDTITVSISPKGAETSRFCHLTRKEIPISSTP